MGIQRVRRQRRMPILKARVSVKISYKAMTGTNPSDVISGFGVSKVYVEARSSSES